MGLDLLAPFGGDLSLGPLPDTSLVGSGAQDFNFLVSRDELIQRLVHRYFTAPGEWIAFPTYGAGLRVYVDATLSQQAVSNIQSLILQQTMQEPDISPTPSPNVLVSIVPNGIAVTVQFYTLSQQLVSFRFNPANPAFVQVGV